MFRCAMLLVRILSFTSGFVIRRVIWEVSHLNYFETGRFQPYWQKWSKKSPFESANLDDLAKASFNFNLAGVSRPFVVDVVPATGVLKPEERLKALLDHKEVILICARIILEKQMSEKNTSFEILKTHSSFCFFIKQCTTYGIFPVLKMPAGPIERWMCASGPAFLTWSWGGPSYTVDGRNPAPVDR